MQQIVVVVVAQEKEEEKCEKGEYKTKQKDKHKPQAGTTEERISI